MFQVGNQVQLASGGPVMTVSAIIDGTTTECQWFDGNHTHHVQNFITLTLVAYSNDW
ncbi:YodC family protein [Vibrio splendidus]|uniref:YodC family protein n=1 Tax=Vibrio sp. 10N.247.310.34 TaxID=3229982 RepID=UPI0035501664